MINKLDGEILVRIFQLKSWLLCGFLATSLSLSALIWFAWALFMGQHVQEILFFVASFLTVISAEVGVNKPLKEIKKLNRLLIF